VTDPTPDQRIDGTSLEPWALELLENSNAASDPNAREETARVVSLLRGLEEPTQDPERVDRVIQALAEQRARPKLVRAAFGAVRRALQPPVALALAAGMAGLLAITVAPGMLPLLGSGELGSGEELGSNEGPADIAPPTRIASSPSAHETRPKPVRRRPTPVIRPQLVNVSAFSPSSAMAPNLGYDRAPLESAYDRGLDRQLNQLMIDPDAFARRLERVRQRDRFIARLADRAAQRGDAPEIALRVRQSRHPLAGQLVDRLLRSTIVASVSPR
jgi:hypothetical protein